MLVVAIVAHVPQGFWVGNGKVGWEFPLPLAAGGFAIALIGNGSWSLDGAFGLTYSEQLRWAWLAIVGVGVLVALGTTMLLAPKKAAA